jgi:hypothetical protein
MSEIQALTLKIRELSENVDLWNVLMLWGLGVAAAAAVFIVISTRIIVTRSGQLSEAQSSLTAAKDRQLQVDLKAKDVEIDGLKAKSQEYESEISGAKRDAATATSKAAKANESAEKEHLERLEQFHSYCNVWIESLNQAFAFSGVMRAMASVMARSSSC